MTSPLPLQDQTAKAATRLWLRFSVMLLAMAACAGALLAGFVVWADPYGARIRPGSPAPVLMDSNQRFMYPQLVRSGRFDSAVIGTSSSRLLDPQRLSQLFDASFANLAMNAATPWEQARMMELLRHKWAQPRIVIWGLDATWCEADADSPGKRLTPRPFPEWLYDPAMAEHMLANIPRMLNMTTLEIAGRAWLMAMGLTGPRMRGDGFDEFTPPDVTYDAARAQFHLYRNLGGQRPEALPHDAGVADQSALATPAFTALAFPALAWLEQSLAALPPETRKIILLPPLHAASLPAEGALREREAVCKAAMVAVSGRVNASLLDYRRISPLTTDDNRFWDPLHYRVDAARQIEADLAAADRSGKLASGDGILRWRQGR